MLSLMLCEMLLNYIEMAYDNGINEEISLQAIAIT